MSKKAFVTGGSRGIGRGIVRVLASDGYDVAFTYNSEESSAEEIRAEVEAMGCRCLYYQASLEAPEVPGEVTRRAIADLGGIDLLVCNAGLTRHNSLLTVSVELLDFVYGLNYRSYILCAQAAAQHMVEHQTRGNIVFISSTRGMRAYPEDCLYGSLKAALNRATESMALEMAQYGIRVNCVAPGATKIRGNFTEEELQGGFSRHIPLKRFGTPDEVGHLVSYLASDHAAYITGDVIKIDGGLILPGIPEKQDGWFAKKE